MNVTRRNCTEIRLSPFKIEGENNFMSFIFHYNAVKSVRVLWMTERHK